MFSDPFQYIVKDYLDCKRCGLHKHRRNIVFGRGSIPADVMFIGEAPGRTEDLLAKPFVGPSGRILNQGIRTAIRMGAPKVKYFITNIIACRPCDSHQGKNKEPTKEEAQDCWPRLKQTFDDVKPNRVVLLGKVAKRYAGKLPGKKFQLDHPAYILRLGGTSAPAFRRFWRGIMEVFQDE